MPNIKPLLSSRTLLWTAMLLAMVGSFSHVQNTFQSINGDWVLGWVLSGVQALAVDLGMATLTVNVMQKRRKAGNAAWSWAGIGTFTVISVYANLRYGLAHSTPPVAELWQTDLVRAAVEFYRPYVLAATLPILVFLLAEINGESVATDSKNQQSEEVRALRDANRQLASKHSALEAELERLRGEMAQRAAPALSDEEKALAYLASHPDATQEELGDMLGKSRSTGGNVLRALVESGKAKRNGHGWEVFAGGERQ